MNRSEAAETFAVLAHAGFDAAVTFESDRFDVGQEQSLRTNVVRSEPAYRVTVAFPGDHSLARLRELCHVAGATEDGLAVWLRDDVKGRVSLQIERP